VVGDSQQGPSAVGGWKLRAIAAGLALVLLGAALAAGLLRGGSAVTAQTAPDDETSSAPTAAVPSATASFVSAYGRGDIATMEAIASPLYFVEWARQGVSLGEQASLLQEHQHAPSGEWLYLFYETGLVDSRGFGHYLYVGRPISATGSPSIWRVDADASGRVIWMEMVWLFSSRSLAVQAVQPDAASADSPVRSVLPSGPSDVVFGVRSADGVEGYYGVSPLHAVQATAASLDTVQFYAVDDTGKFRLPGWSYGERFPNRPLAGRQPLQADQASALSSYLASIH